MEKQVEFLKPLLGWLCQLGAIRYEDALMYQSSEIPKFFMDLRNGVILAKIGLIAIPNISARYRNGFCSRALTRYIFSKFAVY